MNEELHSIIGPADHHRRNNWFALSTPELLPL